VSGPGLTTGTEQLTLAAKKHFDLIYHQPAMKFDELIGELNWSPSLAFKPNKNSLIVVEASESVFPAIFNLRRSKLEKIAIPVSVYCVCTEEEFLKSQQLAKELIDAGYGLVTVDGTGAAHTRAECVPIQQKIEF